MFHNLFRSLMQKKPIFRGNGTTSNRETGISPYLMNDAITGWLSASRLRQKRSTCSTYQVIADKHIRPAFGNQPVEAITAIQMSEWLQGKLFGTVQTPAIASSTLCSIITVLRGAFRYAEAQGCRIYAWDALCRPKGNSKETDVLTKEEQKQLESFLLCSQNYEKLGVLLCLYTGLRLGEICALKWGDISLDTGNLSVRRTVQRIRNPAADRDIKAPKTVLVFDAPKSKRSNRVIPLPSVLLERLTQMACAGDCFVLTGDSQKFLEPRTLQNRFKAMLREAGIRDINFHALRHTFATNCVNLGFDPKTLSEIMGHSDVSVTLNTYVHPSLSQKRSYMELLSSSETRK